MELPPPPSPQARTSRPVTPDGTVNSCFAVVGSNSRQPEKPSVGVHAFPASTALPAAVAAGAPVRAVPAVSATKVRAAAPRRSPARRGTAEP
ncbi:hypothetical protein C9J60_17415 [Streptomyces sp. A244]|nr:hypothetical protein C9J60_17415 [Streptomyces sp. A244]